MFLRSIAAHITKFLKPTFQSSLLSSLSPSNPLLQEPTNFNILEHKDWLSPSELVKIFQALRDPDSVLPVLAQASVRKDYKPTEALYAAVINKLALARNFDGIDNVMQMIKTEKSCRLSDGFFHGVIKIYGNEAGRINRAIETLFDMPSYKCWPSVKTFNYVLNLLVKTKQFDVVHEVYMGGLRLGVEIDACCLNIMIKGLCGCGDLDSALQVLDEFPKQGCRPNVRTFSTLMHGLCERGKVEEAFRLFERMEREYVEPDAVTFNILILGLRKQGRIEESIEVFDRMMLKGCVPNPGTYQEVLYGLLDAKKFVDAKDFMRKMLFKGVNPSFESYKLITHGLCSENLLGDVDWVLKQMVQNDFVPRMGMWKRILECVLGSSSFDCSSFDAIIKASVS
ncbi:hypothetical protein RJ640_006424 [Escallonia rubra]|uniref:Pentatricopeptide repeat-containing protein n=1 Tax=Escallonia rubra TaxID=112253 RepID=A0AA88RMK5_9ASTE|nr:hypothetical protein RJ640_006424 [Escallonia rubra]